ncbi:hypothetical protein PHLCEN_2v10176 [Hermanssonia centrifuga]|uniref:Uncharacterized protein n=1 Tax=Hermanssonia centrifuga TaxID=98765 RepID=A0A2R6NNM6_9APHY|nr:hypothetical protein PHLCEN_2v10176 [Hermanssonia centrifuga]
MSAVPLVIPFDVWLVETLADHVETTNLSRSNQASLGSAFMNYILGTKRRRNAIQQKGRIAVIKRDRE